MCLDEFLERTSQLRTAEAEAEAELPGVDNGGFWKRFLISFLFEFCEIYCVKIIVFLDVF